MWGTPHAPLSQQLFSFFVTAPYNVMRTFTNTFSFILLVAVTVLTGCDTVGETGPEVEEPRNSSPVTLGVMAVPVESGVNLSWSVHGINEEPLRTVIKRRSTSSCTGQTACDTSYSQLAVVDDGDTTYIDNVSNGRFEYRIEVKFANADLNTSAVTTVTL